MRVVQRDRKDLKRDGVDEQEEHALAAGLARAALSIVLEKAAVGQSVELGVQWLAVVYRYRVRTERASSVLLVQTAVIRCDRLARGVSLLLTDPGPVRQDDDDDDTLRIALLHEQHIGQLSQHKQIRWARWIQPWRRMSWREPAGEAGRATSE